MTRPFTFKINAAEFFTVVHSMHAKQHSRFLVTLVKDLVTLKPETDYGKKLVSETIDFISKQSEHGKKGGRPKKREPKGLVKAALREPRGCPKPKEEVKEDITPYKEIINDLNQKGGFRFTVCEPTKQLINGRLSEGKTKEDFFHVHSVKIAEWKDNPEYSKFLCPDTLYRPSKFEKYLNQKLPEQNSGNPTWW